MKLRRLIAKLLFSDILEEEFMAGEEYAKESASDWYEPPRMRN